MNLILFDENRQNLMPFTLTRPIAEIRWGILNIRDKWKNISQSVSWLTEDYLSEKFPVSYSTENIYINARYLPDEGLLEEIQQLRNDQSLISRDQQFIALKSSEKISFDKLKAIHPKIISSELNSLQNVWDIFLHNAREIQRDYDQLTANRTSQQLSSSNTILGKNIFAEEGVRVEAAVLNSNTGPIYIGKNAEIMEGSIIRGPFALGEEGVVKMGAKIYGPTTVGPHSKVGGEINNSVIFGYSNKGHDGFLGNSVMGEWCNLGADTNVSNLKNDYGMVKVWDYTSSRLKDSGQQFCGLMMGDHSKSGINTMFNTGTTVGVSANIFGAGFPDKFIPSFSWGGKEKLTEYRLDKALQVAEMVMRRRNVELSAVDRNILQAVFEQTASYRKF